jgi:tetratricopeptide (TPR) repeat protein
MIYALLAGLRTVTDFDLGWQMATGKWIAEHHQIPSVDVFSYTAQGQPWIYPVGSELLFYAAFLLGGWALLSWLGAAVCTGTVALLLRRGSLITATLAVLVIPRIAFHTTPRADMFTVLIFAAFLSLLWEQYESGTAKLWLLPCLMAAWVNLHLGFISGVALLAAYLVLEAFDLIQVERRAAARKRLRKSARWLGATVAATLVNPWGWGIYRALLRQNAAMREHSQWITEWAPARLSWTLFSSAWSVRGTTGTFYTMLLIATIAILVALWRRQFGAALLLAGALWFSIRHIRFEALLAVVLVVVGGAALKTAFVTVGELMKQDRLRWLLAAAAVIVVIALACVRSADLVSNRTYLSTTEMGSFGTGLSWWFPEGAARFLERENIPGEIFNSYEEGGYLTWQLGEKYRDYIDGRALPFGPELFLRNSTLLGTPPESREWHAEAARYNINAMIIPLGRYNALQFFPVLRQFCADLNWRPVYLDEVSAVFVRRTARTATLVDRLQIDCSTAPIPPRAPAVHPGEAFNQWANAAALLQVLGRNPEALYATAQALAIFPDSPFVHFVRGNLLRDVGNLKEAEQQYLAAAALESNAVIWSTLADLYHREGRLWQEIHAREKAIEFLAHPAMAWLSLGYSYVDAQRPQDALRAFSRAESSGQEESAGGAENAFLANLAHGRSLAWNALGNLTSAISFEETTLRWSPDRAEDWLQLATLYDRQGRIADAQKARERAALLGVQPSALIPSR